MLSLMDKDGCGHTPFTKPRITNLAAAGSKPAGRARKSDSGILFRVPGSFLHRKEPYCLFAESHMKLSVRLLSVSRNLGVCPERSADGLLGGFQPRAMSVGGDWL